MLQQLAADALGFRIGAGSRWNDDLRTSVGLRRGKWVWRRVHGDILPEEP
ncbi:MAG TPA: hypothetical protein VHZ24_18040 [Pirellulales bacterium]|nr:hypothetical protein [Pirellulales bacterium]